MEVLHLTHGGGNMCMAMLQLAERRQGNHMYSTKQYDAALQHYVRAKSIVDIISGMASSDQHEIDENRAAVCLNMAAVHLARQHFADAAKCCTDALQSSSCSVKAYLRRANAYIGLHEYQVGKVCSHV